MNNGSSTGFDFNAQGFGQKTNNFNNTDGF